MKKRILMGAAALATLASAAAFAGEVKLGGYYRFELLNEDSLPYHANGQVNDLGNLQAASVSSWASTAGLTADSRAALTAFANTQSTIDGMSTITQQNLISGAKRGLGGLWDAAQREVNQGRMTAAQRDAVYRRAVSASNPPTYAEGDDANYMWHRLRIKMDMIASQKTHAHMLFQPLETVVQGANRYGPTIGVANGTFSPNINPTGQGPETNGGVAGTNWEIRQAWLETEAWGIGLKVGEMPISLNDNILINSDNRSYGAIMVSKTFGPVTVAAADIRIAEGQLGGQWNTAAAFSDGQNASTWSSNDSIDLWTLAVLGKVNNISYNVTGAYLHGDGCSGVGSGTWNSAGLNTNNGGGTTRCAGGSTGFRGGATAVNNDTVIANNWNLISDSADNGRVNATGGNRSNPLTVRPGGGDTDNWWFGLTVGADLNVAKLTGTVLYERGYDGIMAGYLPTGFGNVGWLNGSAVQRSTGVTAEQWAALRGMSNGLPTLANYALIAANSAALVGSFPGQAHTVSRDDTGRAWRNATSAGGGQLATAGYNYQPHIQNSSINDWYSVWNMNVPSDTPSFLSSRHQQLDDSGWLLALRGEGKLGFGGWNAYGFYASKGFNSVSDKPDWSFLYDGFSGGSDLMSLAMSTSGNNRTRAAGNGANGGGWGSTLYDANSGRPLDMDGSGGGSFNNVLGADGTWVTQGDYGSGSILVTDNQNLWGVGVGLTINAGAFTIKPQLDYAHVVEETFHTAGTNMAARMALTPVTLDSWRTNGAPAPTLSIIDRVHVDHAWGGSLQVSTEIDKGTTLTLAGGFVDPNTTAGSGYSDNTIHSIGLELNMAF